MEVFVGYFFVNFSFGASHLGHVAGRQRASTSVLHFWHTHTGMLHLRRGA